MSQLSARRLSTWVLRVTKERRTMEHLSLSLSLTSPQLMEMPSFALSPVAPVRFSLSDPARSTKWNFAVRVSYSFICDDSEITLLSVAFS